MESTILDVDLLAFERGDTRSRRAVVDGVKRSLATGFVYTSSDLSGDLLDTAYGMLARFFALDGASKGRFTAAGASGQTGYTGLLVETAAGSERADWKEMLNWSAPIPASHPLRRRYPLLYPEPVLPEAVVPGITEVLLRFHGALGREMVPPAEQAVSVDDAVGGHVVQGKAGIHGIADHARAARRAEVAGDRAVGGHAAIGNQPHDFVHIAKKTFAAGVSAHKRSFIQVPVIRLVGQGSIFVDFCRSEAVDKGDHGAVFLLEIVGIPLK